MRKLSEDGHQSGKDRKMHVRKKIWFLTRISIQLGRELESSRLEVMVKHRCSVICHKDHRKRVCLQYQGGRPQIYNAQEAQKVGDVGHRIPWIYAVVKNR